MYVEAEVNDDEQFSLVSAHHARNFRGRYLAPVVGVLVLVAMGLGGRAAWHSEVTHWNGVIGEDSYLSSKVRIPVNIRGIDYAALPQTQQVSFITAIKETIVKKGRIPSSSVTIQLEDIESTHPVAGTATDSAARSELDVEIAVPAELTAEALVARLRDGGNLRDLIEQELSDKVTDASYVSVLASSFQVAKSKDHSLVADLHKPLIVLDIDVKGIYYKKLSQASSEVQQSFVQAVQGGISATPGVDIDSTSIGLDISDGTALNSVPFTHITAKIPVPQGISADTFMSRWPATGTDGIAAQIKANVEAMTELESVSKSDTGVIHSIEVTTSALDLGGIRTSFATDITLEMSIHHIKHDKPGDADAVPNDQITKKVQEELVSRAKVAEDEIVVTVVGNDADLLRLQVVISAHGHKAAEDKVSTWEAKLMPAARAVQKFYKDTHPEATQHSNYRVMVGISEVKNKIEFVAMDLIIHGIDVSGVSQDRRQVFFSSLADSVRKGIGQQEASSLSKGTPANYEKMRVAFDEGATEDTVNVRIQIPVTEVVPALDAQGVATLMGNLEKKEVRTGLEEEVRKADGVKFISTWTTDAIKVSVPGHIDDFAGDVFDKSDHL